MPELRAPDHEDSAQEPPPVLGRWSRLYALVLIALAVEIAVFWALTKAFR
jgi:hypothetical protein